MHGVAVARSGVAVATALVVEVAGAEQEARVGEGSVVVVVREVFALIVVLAGGAAGVSELQGDGVGSNGRKTYENSLQFAVRFFRYQNRISNLMKVIAIKVELELNFGVQKTLI